MNRLKHQIVDALCDRYPEPPMFDPRLLAIRDQYIGQTPFAACPVVVVTVRPEASHDEADISVATANRVHDAAADRQAAEARQEAKAEGAD